MTVILIFSGYMFIGFIFTGIALALFDYDLSGEKAAIIIFLWPMIITMLIGIFIGDWIKDKNVT